MMPKGHKVNQPRNVLRDDRIEALWREGVTGGKIAREIGVTRSTVLGVVWRRGLVGMAGHPKLDLGNAWKNRTTAVKPVVVEAPPIIPPEPEPDVPGSFISIIDIRMDQCRWPIDGVRYRGLPVFCGKPIDPRAGRLWCPMHHKKAVSVPHYHKRAKEKA